MILHPNRKNIPLLIHLVTWALVAGLVLMPPFGGRVAMPDEYWVKQWLLLGLLVAIFYLNAKVLLPKLLFKNRILEYLLSIAAAVVAVYWAIQGIEAWLNLPELWHKALGRPFKPNERRFDMFTFLYSLLSLGTSTSITMIQKWQNDAQIREQLEQEKLSSELSFLKAQINPHFFFNTLNNIYALTMIDVDTAREALHKLSRMMRYVLYETKEGTVQLSQEVAFLEDYIQLMQLRLTDKVKVSFEKPQPYQDVAIAPMLLLPFLENAFKHGVSATQPSRIVVRIQQNAPSLTIEVRNTLFPTQSQSLEESNGIGLVNTRRRLDLLYPNRYRLTIVEKTPEEEFLVTLVIQVESSATSTLHSPSYVIAAENET
ncbi:MAG: histidine kinase [Spirosomaceae bacterium]|nr:histidine kinase [Spirosomataceae bacterium]